MKAYDITLGAWSAGAPRPGQGWCFGLPPGIAPGQWPLDPWNGYPLMHGFTLLLPEDYRVHGPEIVALSFFATAPDHGDGGPAVGDPRIAACVEETGSAALDDADLLPIRDQALRAHPRLHRMRDILDCAYAVILLTRDEFAGPPCRPPLIDAPVLGEIDPPAWLAHGSAAYERSQVGAAPEEPAGDLILLHRPITWGPRVQDPNAGLPPREWYGRPPEPGAYQPHFYWLDGVVKPENWREHSWAAGHAADHIGGTMRPVQATPKFSPFYVEFEETFGGYNFGGGNGQLDFRDMRFDWACG